MVCSEEDKGEEAAAARSEPAAAPELAANSPPRQAVYDPHMQVDSAEGELEGGKNSAASRGAAAGTEKIADYQAN
eukprot:CAMPEP_0181342554 /NCGR_PEP_ID=MMETSP1101-20121128/31067_1 /TAXON_ID=46948 /ORGANISM="Rhodomonas abbreviata, Strain Caron Lab Isolate" /LENGTH=74 /DNA_ID=CAMNT_0023454029 /DNA_START=73 /DNA_END=294 /DNA_ORIENTATION=+